MAITELIFGAKRLVRVGVDASLEFLPAGAIEFDAVVEEQHDAEVDITQFPAEEGADLNDHIRPLPESITLEGIVTNTPIVFLAGVTTDPLRAEVAYEKLRTMKNNGDLVSVVTTLRLYENMVIKSMSVLRNAKNGNVMRCTLTLREFFTAQTKEVNAPVAADGQAGTAGAANLGEQTGSAAAAGSTQSAGLALVGSLVPI